MDYRKFLGRSESMVLPYMGGASIDTPDRRLRMQGRPSAGWYTFRVEGRNATAVGPAQAPDLSALAAVRGHLVGRWLFGEGAAVALQLLPDGDEPEILSPCCARRWHSGDLLFDGLEMEAGPEAEARVSLEERAPLSARGATASLRLAYGFALCLAVGRDMRVRVSPVEVLGLLTGIAQRGQREAEATLGRIAQERLLARVMGGRSAAADAASAGRQPPALVAAPVAEAQVVPAAITAPAYRPRAQAPFEPARPVAVRLARVRGAARGAQPATLGNAAERAEAALEAAGADMRSARTLAGGNLEVTYRFMGERFISVVNALTLQVVDAGICLAGADRQATVDSMPAIIREAIETGKLVITRH